MSFNNNWTGAVDNDPTVAGNYTGGLPVATTDFVSINAVTADILGGSARTGAGKIASVHISSNVGFSIGTSGTAFDLGDVAIVDYSGRGSLFNLQCGHDVSGVCDVALRHSKGLVTLMDDGNGIDTVFSRSGSLTVKSGCTIADLHYDVGNGNSYRLILEDGATPVNVLMGSGKGETQGAVNITDLLIGGGEFTSAGTGTTGLMVVAGGGRCVYTSSGTITEAVILPGGVLDLSQEAQASLTLTRITSMQGGLVIYGEMSRFTVTTGLYFGAASVSFRGVLQGTIK